MNVCRILPSHLPLLLMLALVAAPTRADETPDAASAPPASLLRRVQWLSWASDTEWQDPLAPLQRRSGWRSELRPDIDWQGGAWQLHARPRLAAGNDGQDAWMNEAVLGWQHGAWSLRAGREVLLWGPSMFRVLSDPLWPDNGRNDPQREMAGHDLVRVDYAARRNIQLQWVQQFDHGHEAVDRRRREQVGLLRLQLTGDASSVDVVLSRRAGETPRLGLSGQVTASDALLLYADSSIGRREGAGLPGLPLHSGNRIDWLTGLSWTFESGHTLHAELYWHGAGLSDSENSAWQARWQSGPLPGRAALLDPGIGPLGRRHFAVQLMNGSDARVGWIIRAQHGLDDGSGELVTQLTHDLSARCQLWANALGHYGPTDSDYNRTLAWRLQAGLTVYFR